MFVYCITRCSYVCFKRTTMFTDLLSEFPGVDKLLFSVTWSSQAKLQVSQLFTGTMYHGVHWFMWGVSGCSQIHEQRNWCLQVCVQCTWCSQFMCNVSWCSYVYMYSILVCVGLCAVHNGGHRFTYSVSWRSQVYVQYILVFLILWSETVYFYNGASQDTRGYMKRSKKSEMMNESQHMVELISVYSQVGYRTL